MKVIYPPPIAKAAADSASAAPTLTSYAVGNATGQTGTTSQGEAGSLYNQLGENQSRATTTDAHNAHRNDTVALRAHAAAVLAELRALKVRLREAGLLES
jgi:hypothetical protein